MKVFLQPTTSSRGIQRVVKALIDYAPNFVEVVDNAQDAEFEVIHVYGRYDAVRSRVERLRRAGKPYAIIQYALRSTQKPHTSQWMNMWENARVVWSYYDLFRLCDHDLVSGEFNFYHAPLGVDTSVFYNRKVTDSPRIYEILATSQHALAEGARECSFAVKRVGKKMFFVGHELRRGKDIVCHSDVSDEDLAHIYSECNFVSGLRRIEGFEFPVIEGAMCGARPIVFDRPEMRHWFNDFAIFIKEGTRDSVIDSLEAIFQQNLPSVSDKEKSIIRDKFNWSRIINGFWRETL